MHDPDLRARLGKLVPTLDLILIREPKTGRALMESFGGFLRACDDERRCTRSKCLTRRGTGKWGDHIGVNLRFARYTEVGQPYINKIRSVLHQSARKHSASLMSLPISCNVHDGISKRFGNSSRDMKRFR